jgi:hypothetical protein
MVAGTVGGEEGFEDLLDGHLDFFGYGDGGEVFGVDFILAEGVGDGQGVEESCAVGFGCRLHTIPFLGQRPVER